MTFAESHPNRDAANASGSATTRGLRVQLAGVDVGDIHGEIEGRPGQFHPAVAEEQALNLVRTGASQDLTPEQGIPFREPSTVHAVHRRCP